MTNGQRQKIKKLRYQGVGYGKIAKATGLLRDSVRNYCATNLCCLSRQWGKLYSIRHQLKRQNRTVV